MLGNMYYTTDEFTQTQTEEEVTWSKMQFIQGLQQLTPADIHDFSIFLAEAHSELDHSAEHSSRAPMGSQVGAHRGQSDRKQHRTRPHDR